MWSERRRKSSTNPSRNVNVAIAPCEGFGIVQDSLCFEKPHSEVEDRTRGSLLGGAALRKLERATVGGGPDIELQVMQFS